MNVGSILVAVLFRLIKTLFSEKVVLNLVVVFASWAVSRWGNDLTKELYEPLKDALDNYQGRPGNLYDEVKGK